MWWMQRASAVLLLALLATFLVRLSLHPPASYMAWRAWLGQPYMVMALVVFFASLLAHMWVGLRDVSLDYAKPAGLRLALLAFLAAALVSIGAWVLWLAIGLIP